METLFTNVQQLKVVQLPQHCHLTLLYLTCLGFSHLLLSQQNEDTGLCPWGHNKVSFWDKVWEGGGSLESLRPGGMGIFLALQHLHKSDLPGTYKPLPGPQPAPLLPHATVKVGTYRPRYPTLLAPFWAPGLTCSCDGGRGFKEEAWAPPLRSRPWKVPPGPLVPRSSEPLGAVFQFGKTPGDGPRAKEGATGLAGLGLGIGFFSEAGCRDNSGMESRAFQG